MENKTNSIVHALYLEYTGRKGNLLDSAMLAKAGCDHLKDDERLYALIHLLRLYSFIGYYPIFEEVMAKTILLRCSEKEDVRIDLDKFVTELDKAEEYLKVISLFAKFENVADKRLAVFNELNSYYSEGKDFNNMLNSYLNPKSFDRESLVNVHKKISSFLRKYDKSDDDVEVTDNILDIIFSEVKEDLDEILA